MTLVIDSDAHGVDTLEKMRFGVATARRAWLTPRTGGEHPLLDSSSTAAQARRASRSSLGAGCRLGSAARSSAAPAARSSFGGPNGELRSNQNSHAVALLDRLHGGRLLAPQQRHEQRVAGGDRPAPAARRSRPRRTRPRAAPSGQSRLNSTAPGSSSGSVVVRRAPGQQPADAGRGRRAPPEPEPDRPRPAPTSRAPRAAAACRRRAAGADHRHGGERGGRAAEQQHRRRAGSPGSASGRGERREHAGEAVDAVDHQVGALDDARPAPRRSARPRARRPRASPSLDAAPSSASKASRSVASSPPKSAVRALRAGHQVAHRLALVDRHGRPDLEHLAAPVGGEARPPRPRARCPRGGCARRPRRARRASGRPRSAPCPRSAPAAARSSGVSCSAANARTRPSQLAKAGISCGRSRARLEQLGAVASPRRRCRRRPPAGAPRRPSGPRRRPRSRSGGRAGRAARETSSRTWASSARSTIGASVPSMSQRTRRPAGVVGQRAQRSRASASAVGADTARSMPADVARGSRRLAVDRDRGRGVQRAVRRGRRHDHRARC